jgi:hypothetical protein
MISAVIEHQCDSPHLGRAASAQLSPEILRGVKTGQNCAEFDIVRSNEEMFVVALRCGATAVVMKISSVPSQKGMQLKPHEDEHLKTQYKTIIVGAG